MNPIWRVAHEMSKTRSETQKKNQRRREVAKSKRMVKQKLEQEASDRDRQRYMVGQENADGDDDPQPTSEEESVAEKFQKELCWCIEQLELGLNNPKSTHKQKLDSERILRVLKSSKAPMAKKRQVMHSSFGDYRKKMQDEKKKLAAAMRKSSVGPAGEAKAGVGKFFRRSASQEAFMTAAVNTCPQKVENNEADLNKEKEDKEKETVVMAINDEIHKENGDAFKTPNGVFKFEFDVQNQTDEHCSDDDHEDVKESDDNDGEKCENDVQVERTETCQQEATLETVNLQQQIEGLNLATVANT